MNKFIIMLIVVVVHAYPSTTEHRLNNPHTFIAMTILCFEESSPV